MAECLESKVFDIPPGWETVAKQIVAVRPDNKVFFVDVEFFTDSRIIEIAILDADGHCVLHTNVSYHETVSELAKSPQEVYSARRIYGGEQTNGMTLPELAAELLKLGITKDSIIVEWSTNNCDYRAIHQAFQDYPDVMAILPPKHRWMRALTSLWKVLLPGCPSFALDLLHDVVFPEDTGNLHHFAKVDAQKLYKMVRKALVDMCRVI